MSMAMTHSDMVAGVAVHAGVLITSPAHDYAPVPIFMAHGLLDGDFPYEAADLTGLGIYSTLGKEEELKLLGNLNECDETVVDNDAVFAPPEARLLKRVNCRNNAEVHLLAYSTAGHFPMAGEFRGDLEDNPNITPVTLDSTAMMWDFLQPYSKTDAPDLSRQVPESFLPSSFFTILLTVLARVGEFFQRVRSFVPF